MTSLMVMANILTPRTSDIIKENGRMAKKRGRGNRASRMALNMWGTIKMIKNMVLESWFSGRRIASSRDSLKRIRLWERESKEEPISNMMGRGKTALCKVLEDPHTSMIRIE